MNANHAAWLRTAEHVICIGASIQFLLFLRRRGFSGLVKSILSVVLSTSRAIPGLSQIVDNELAKEVHHVEEKMLGDGDMLDLTPVAPDRNDPASHQD